MKEVQIPDFDYRSIDWIESDNPEYEKRSRETYSYCEKCGKNHPEPETYLYENHKTKLYIHCHRCGYTVSLAELTSIVYPYT